MPDAPAAPCTFSGTAAAVRVQGFGPAVLLERAPFEKGNAARVILEGAVLHRNRAPIVGLKLLPNGNKPVSAWGPGGEDAALDSVAQGISQVIDALLRQRAEQQGAPAPDGTAPG